MVAVKPYGAATCLPALIGAWRHVGGGILQFPVWEHPYKFDVICRPDLIPEGTPVVNNLQLGRVLTGEIALKTPIQSMMVWNTNPITQAPETDKIIRGLARENLFFGGSRTLYVGHRRLCGHCLASGLWGRRWRT